jgi:hypothetical protein
MKIDEISRDELKQIMKEAIAEVLSEMSVDSDGKIKPEIEQQLLSIRKRRHQEDRTLSADELKRSLGLM